MKKFYIKKVIIAKDLRSALKNERKSELTEIYEDYSYNHVSDKKIKPF